MKVAPALAVLMLAAAAAHAQPVSGFYVQGSAGLTLPQQQSINLPSAPSGEQPSSAASADAAINGKPGVVQSGSAGWGFGNGLRLEMQGVHTDPGVGTTN